MTLSHYSGELAVFALPGMHIESLSKQQETKDHAFVELQN